MGSGKTQPDAEPTSGRGRQPHANTRVSREAWLRGALDLVAEQGVAAVKVEALARRLGITKGSFYWHFEDRADLIASALDLWLQLGTLDIIERLALIEDPEARLRALFGESFGDLVDGPIDAQLLVLVDDPTVGPVVRRVTAERLAFLEQAYRDLGLAPDRAAARAWLAYATYVGSGQLDRVAPPSAKRTRAKRAAEAAFARELEVLLAP